MLISDDFNGFGDPVFLIYQDTLRVE